MQEVEHEDLDYCYSMLDCGEKLRAVRRARMPSLNAAQLNNAEDAGSEFCEDSWMCLL